MPIKSTRSILRMGAALPTDARALSPMYFPTTILSTVLYNCWAILPITIGIENNPITNSGKAMLLTNIIEKQKEKMPNVIIGHLFVIFGILKV